MRDSDFQVNGTLIWYYYICKRQVWLMAHALVPDQEDDNIRQGRDIQSPISGSQTLAVIVAVIVAVMFQSPISGSQTHICIRLSIIL
jgi:hypothetical protein